MSLYPKIIVGETPVQRHLEGVAREQARLYICQSISEVRDTVCELCFLSRFPGEVSIYLPTPSKVQFNPLLKFMEESQLKLVLLVPYDCVPSTIVSRSASFEKDDEPRFVHPLKKLKMSKSLRAKVYQLFDV